jgi:hypothetical protein
LPRGPSLGSVKIVEDAIARSFVVDVNDNHTPVIVFAFRPLCHWQAVYWKSEPSARRRTLKVKITCFIAIEQMMTLENGFLFATRAGAALSFTRKDRPWENFERIAVRLFN